MTIPALLLAASLCIGAVHDGDTIRTCSGERVRLIGIDAWIRVTSDGSEPALTPAMLVVQQEEPVFGHRHGEPDFYPDEFWPDE